jgi:flagellar hook-associated protein 3 FlgL
MRIASSTAFESSLANLQKRQQSLSGLQEQLTAGKRVLRPSDDPAAAAQAERARAALARNDGQQRALDASKNAMQLGESALGDAGDLLQRARELVIQAGNGGNSDADRKTLADAIRGVRNDLLAVANRDDGAGRYLFGGQGTGGAPMVDTPGVGVVFKGTAGQLQAAAGESTLLSLDGRAAFLQAPDPANPGSTVSVFDVLDKAVNELSTPGRTADLTSKTVSDSLAGIDASQANLSSWRSSAGEALNRIDGIGNRLSQGKIDAESQRSQAEDLDMITAISDFQNRQSGYDAALKTYSMVQKMSLFDYIK